ncbi:MAG TPA: hypothetical protein VGU46_10715 [Acidobacteriaceae bacterium]|nr:hypothetical protein [Acidobacteriaceae bacterium]
MSRKLPSALPLRLVASAASFALLAALALPAHAQSASDKPLLKQLPRFSAAGVPATAPEELPVGDLHAKKPMPTGLPSGGASQRPMLYIGEGFNRIFLIDKGKTIWKYDTGPGNELDDIWMLSNGNILYTRMQYIAELTPEKKVVWRYDAPKGTEIHTCQPIGLDKVLFILNGLPAPRLLIMNIKNSKIELDHAMPAVSSTDPKTIHPQFRRIRLTAKGTYLASFLKMNKVVEYDKNFDELWSYSIKSPWAALRLKNGNTLITDEDDVLTREVNPKGETVWELTKKDIPEQYWYGNAQAVERLENGDTIICSRGGSGQGPQLVEVTPDKKVVWVMQDWANFGPATSVQLLDETGYPERPGQTLH